MRRSFLAPATALSLVGLSSAGCSSQWTCNDDGTCGVKDGSVCTPADGGGWDCYAVDAAAGRTDGSSGADGGNDASLGDGGGDAGAPDARGDSANDGGNPPLDGAADGDGAVPIGCDADAGLQLCGGQCVAMNDVHYCGGCANACAAPDGGTAECLLDGGTYGCSFTCESGEHVCGGQCLPNTDNPSVDPCVITTEYGVFVSPTGVDTGDAGTMTAPFQTIGYALTQLGGKSRVYACGTAGSYPENLVLSSSVNLYGGFDCSSVPWTYHAADVATVAPTNGIALDVTGGTSDVEDFAFTSADAGSPGGSSIAVFATTPASVTFRRCTMTAGTGANAAPVSSAQNYAGATPVGSPPDGGTAGAGGYNACLISGWSRGGAGGDGPSGGDGGTGTASGTLVDAGAGTNGTGGVGGQFGCGASAKPGANGASGAPAATGAARLGTLTASGWVPQAGASGLSGSPGQGGGGGGGEDSVTPVGGGGGGAGGCGGAGSPGGGGGGSSFALLSYNATVNMFSCTLSAGMAGNGAAGAPGQTGQGGGGYGLSGCNGAYGGNGAGGGAGGGGAGGVSATMGYVGSPPTYDMATSGHLSATSGGGSGGAGATGGDGGSNGFLPQAAPGLASTGGVDGGAFTTPVPLN